LVADFGPPVTRSIFACGKNGDTISDWANDGMAKEIFKPGGSDAGTENLLDGL
jgi:hypothetical protein